MHVEGPGLLDELVIVSGWRLVHDLVLVLAWILSFWIVKVLVRRKGLDPRPYEAVKVLGPLGVVILLVTRPFGIGTPLPSDRVTTGQLAAVTAATLLLLPVMLFVVPG